MDRKTLQVITSVAASVIVIAIGTGLTLYLAHARTKESVLRQLDRVAAEAHGRSVATLEQQLSVVSALEQAQPDPDCSSEHMVQMRTAQASASYLKGLGVLDGNVLLCTTLLPIRSPVDLGEPDRTDTSSGFRSWNEVVLPDLPDTILTVDGRGHYALFLIPDLVVDVAAGRPGISVAHIGTVHKPWQLIRQRGSYDFRGLLDHYDGRRSGFWHEEQFIFALRLQAPSAVILAAMNRQAVDQVFNASLRLYGPAGALATFSALALVLLAIRWCFSMRAAIRRALKNREFHLVYQPVMDLKTGRFVGAEALVRWTDKNGRQINPGVFIPAAEDSGLIRRITRQVIELVADDVARLVAEMPDTHIAINFSPSDVVSPHTQVWLTRMVERAGIGAGNVMVEITERGVMQPRKARDRLVAIRAKGFRLAIDDFGTGFSSLSQLATYRFDFLKIDKSFVDVICSGTLSSRVALHVIELAKSLGMQMIAEGVESKEQLAALRAAGVQYGQGWLFAKAMPFGEMLDFARAHMLRPAAAVAAMRA